MRNVMDRELVVGMWTLLCVDVMFMSNEARMPSRSPNLIYPHVNCNKKCYLYWRCVRGVAPPLRMIGVGNSGQPRGGKICEEIFVSCVRPTRGRKENKQDKSLA